MKENFNEQLPNYQEFRMYPNLLWTSSQHFLWGSGVVSRSQPAIQEPEQVHPGGQRYQLEGSHVLPQHSMAWKLPGRGVGSSGFHFAH